LRSGRRWSPAVRRGFIASCLLAAAGSLADEIVNLTGLPVYPNLTKAVMDPAARTNALGRWCTRFSAETSYPLDTVETWYRKALPGASETDLINDRTYKNYPDLSGIKLALGLNYVTVFKATTQAPTSIELFKCGP
jgi:hypothetical protein